MFEDVRTRSVQATQAAEEFSKLYFETFDKRRQAICKIYQEKATVVWNGNVVTGTEEIMKFFDSLPQSDFVTEGMDTQPIGAGIQNGGNNSIMVTFYGKVKFTGSEFKTFTQTFILSAQENKWKIVSDNFRFTE